MFLAFGMMCAIFEAQRSGQGQVVDAAVCDGSAVLTALMQGWRGARQWNVEARANVGNGAAPFFNTYRCADGRDISLGPIEDKFYQLLCQTCGLTSPVFAEQWNQAAWPEAKRQLADVFAARTRAEWVALLEGTDTCFAPVLDLEEAPRHPHNVARQAFVEVDGVVQPAPAPRFSRSGSRVGLAVATPGADTAAVLRDLGLSDEAIAGL
jgi:alpha-methylacyl-CoA racemase